MRSIYIKLYVLAVFVALAALPAAAQNGKIDNIAEQAAQVTEFEVNGLKVLLKHRDAAPTFAAALFVRGGARNLTDANAGIERLTLSAATEGGKKFPRQVLRRELSRTGSSISAGSSQDYSVFSAIATRPNFDRIWELFTDVAINPAFNPEDVERVKQQMLVGLRERDTVPEAAVESLQRRIIYSGHPYANDVSGTIETVSSFTPADLQGYHKKVMQTSQLLLVVVGDIEPALLKAKVTESFGKLPRGNYKETPLPALDFTKGTVDVTSRSIPTNYVQGVFNAPSLANPDYYAMRVAMTILQERVFQEVRVRRQLSYAPNAELDNFAANTAEISVSAVDANRAVGVMLGEIDSLKSNPVGSDDISARVGQFLTTYYIGQETNAAQAAELARYELIGGGWRNSFEFLNRIREVKPEDIRTVANKYMKNIRFAVVGTPDAVDRSVFLRAE
jgi:zinc protease